MESTTLPQTATFGRVAVSVDHLTRIAEVYAAPEYDGDDWDDAVLHLARLGYGLDLDPVEVREDGTERYIAAVPGDDADLAEIATDWTYHTLTA